MYKVVWFARFPQGMDKADARRYWAEHHGPLAASTGIERYVQNHVTGPVPAVSGVLEEKTFFDGYSCGWWTDRVAYDATMASPEWKAVEDDGDNVFDMTWLAGMSAEIREHTVIDGRRARSRSSGSAAFSKAWTAARDTATGRRSTARSSPRSTSTATSRTTSSRRSTKATSPASTGSPSAGSGTRSSSRAPSRATSGPRPWSTATTSS